MVKTCPEVEAMLIKPPCHNPDGTWNSEYGKWYYWKNREKQLENAKAWRTKNPGKKRKQDIDYRAKNLVKLKLYDRDRYRDNPKRRKDSKNRASKSYRANKKQKLAYQTAYHHRMRADPKYCDRQKLKHGKRPGKKKTKGVLYFFRSETGYFKVGCTTMWEKRRKTYTGPSSIERLFFVRPVPDMFYAEMHMRIFLRNHGYKHHKGGCFGDWFLPLDGQSPLVDPRSGLLE